MSMLYAYTVIVYFAYDKVFIKKFYYYYYYGSKKDLQAKVTFKVTEGQWHC